VARDGESGLLDRIGARLGHGPAGEVWAGDDAAAFPSPGAQLLFTTDTMVEGVDFDLDYCAGYDIGWKALHITVSDIAAMGGHPTHAVSSLSLPAHTEVAFVDDFMEGLSRGAASVGVHLVGGDLSRADTISVNLALVGATEGSAPVLRSGARSGHALCVTGHLGGSRGGLHVLKRGLRGRDRDVDSRLTAASERLARRHLRPTARVRAGRALARLGASAMIDISDGLVIDLNRLMSASGTGCQVEPADVPVEPDLEVLAGASLKDGFLDPLDAALTGGEDFELLFSIDQSLVDEMTSSLGETGTHVTLLGTVTEGASMIGERSLDSWEEPGWDHLRGG
jgi:thiamine-monophosphate kinase